MPTTTPLAPHPDRLLPADPGLQVNAYTAEPGSPADDGLKLLATWAATTPGAACTARLTWSRVTESA